MQKKGKALPSKSSINSQIKIGRVVSTFGLKGDLKISPTGDILSSLAKNSKLHLLNSDVIYTIQTIRKQKNIFVLKLNEANSIEEAEKLLNTDFYYPMQESKNLLKKDEHFVFQLIGLNPIYKDKKILDYKVMEVLENPVHPILQFQAESNEILIPYINQFIGQINLSENTIEVFNWEDWFVED